MKKDKPRDIARGVLPSKARKGARDNKRGYHAKHRAVQRQTNHRIERSLAVVTEDGTIAHDPDLFDDFEEQTVYDGYDAGTKDSGISWDDMNYIVSRRRDADKLGPLLRWAQATHDRLMTGPEWTTADKRAYFKAILPDTLQGRHALGHVETHLDLEENPYHYSYGRTNYHRPTKDEFRVALDRLLSTSKGRMDFHDFRLEVVPSAAHPAEGNNLIRTTVHAVDENGEKRYITDPIFGRVRPHMVEAFVPQPIKVTCDDCSFLRNDPLSTTDAINRFVELVWDRIRPPRWRSQPDVNIDTRHVFLTELRDYVLYGTRTV